MMARTHRLVGGTTGFVVSTAAGLPIALSAGLGVVAFAASTLPDDLEKGRIPHRTLTHYPVLQLTAVLSLSLVAYALSGAPIALFFGAGVAIGCVMHSCADAMTVDPRGIRLLWPLTRRGFHLLPRSLRVWVGTKSRSEWVFGLVWSVIVLSYLYARFSPQIPA